MRPQAEIDNDLAKMKEAAYWIPRTGHTRADEIATFEVAASRVMTDVGIDECIRELFDCREDFIEYLANQNRAPAPGADIPETLPEDYEPW
jgi:hypothetical protein